MREERASTGRLAHCDVSRHLERRSPDGNSNSTGTGCLSVLAHEWDHTLGVSHWLDLTGLTRIHTLRIVGFTTPISSAVGSRPPSEAVSVLWETTS